MTSARDPRPAEPAPDRDDLRAAVAARRELGPDYEDAVLESFLARLERSVEQRVDARLAERAGLGSGRGDSNPGLVLGLVSLGTGIPITAIAGEQGLGGIVVAWAGIAAVNAAHAWGRRRRG